MFRDERAGEGQMLEQQTQDLMINIHALLPLIVGNALSVIGAILILIIGLWLSGRADRLVVGMLSRTPHFDAMLKSFFGSLTRYLVLTVTVLAVLSQFGIQTTSLVAVLGAAGLAVGLALQGTLSNLAAGIMLLIFRPFRIGQRVQIGGNTGTVKDLSLFWTELVSEENVQIIVPNGGVWGQPLRNFSVYPAPPHTGEVRCRVPYSIDIEEAMGTVRGLLETDRRILADPPPTVLLDNSDVERAIEIVATFSTVEDETPIVKSDLIRAAHAELESRLGDHRENRKAVAKA
jgi:small conductance mechanosensitive channel